MRPLVVGLSLFLGISGGSWATMHWLSIERGIETLAALNARIEQARETLDEIEETTWGVTLRAVNVKLSREGAIMVRAADGAPAAEPCGTRGSAEIFRPHGASSGSEPPVSLEFAELCDDNWAQRESTPHSR